MGRRQIKPSHPGGSWTENFRLDSSCLYTVDTIAIKI